jgi:hypothetical protein
MVFRRAVRLDLRSGRRQPLSAVASRPVTPSGCTFVPESWNTRTYDDQLLVIVNAWKIHDDLDS